MNSLIKTFVLFTLISSLNQVVFAVEPEKSEIALLKGYIKDLSNGDKLVGATVFIKELQTGTITNVQGFFSLRVPPGTYSLSISYVGYQAIEEKIKAEGEISLNYALHVNRVDLKEAIISSRKKNENIIQNQMSSIRINAEDIKRMPAFMGEADVLKAIQLLPGVQSSGEGFSGFNVRGGSADQNLILLDDAAVYNSSHLLGFFSVFNSDAIKDVKIYKGDIPTQYGGRLSSLLDIRMKDGNAPKPQLTGGVGSIASRLTLETPIMDKSSLLLSGRRTYADLFLPLAKDSMMHNNKLFFYDLNLKANISLNEKNRLQISSYAGRDVFAFQDIFNMGWGNATGTIRWNHIFNERLFLSTSAIYSGYNYSMETSEESASFEWKSFIRDLGGKMDLTWYAGDNNTFRLGYQAMHHHIEPGSIKNRENGLKLGVPVNRAMEYAVYISNDQKLSDNLLLNYGLRASMLQNIGEATVFQYDENYDVIDSVKYTVGKAYHGSIGLEPRVSLSYILNPSLSFKGSYSKTRQYLQLASNSSSGLPMDVWFPSSPNIKPQISDQLAAGIFKNLFNDQLEISLEGYYKKMYNQIDFKDNAQLFFNDKLEGEIRTGNAISYGLEFMIRKQMGDLTGWIGYTLSTSRRNIAEINNGKWYRSNYDKPHNVVVVASYDLSRRVNLGANWVFSSGAPITLPTGKWEYGNMILPSYSERNGYRLPDYHRLDLSATIKLNRRPNPKIHHELNISCYNVYSRKNPFTIYFEPDKADNNTMKAYKLSMFGIIPAVTWNFKF
jgi:hypothetical protein